MREVFHVYMTASKSRVIYVGMTNDLARRVREHKEKGTPSFTNRFNVDRLVWYEEHGGPRSAIAREKQIKGWVRAKKIALIEAKNLQWKDLSIDF
jgi:putative endonuclease